MRVQQEPLHPELSQPDALLYAGLSYSKTLQRLALGAGVEPANNPVLETGALPVGLPEYKMPPLDSNHPGIFHPRHAPYCAQTAIWHKKSPHVSMQGS